MPIGIPLPAATDPLTAMARRINDLEKLVQQLAAAPTLSNATISQGGLQIVNSGSIQVIDTDGHVVAQIGALPSQYNRSDGSTQPGLIFYREDSSQAAILGDLNATTPPFKQAWQVTDRANHIVLADDTNGGVGLARPHIEAGGMADTNIATWPATNATTFTTIANRYMEIQNPLCTWQILLYSDSGITSQFRLLVNGAQMGSTQTVGSNTFSTWSTNAVPPGVAYGDVPLIELQALVSSATGKAHGICQRFSGIQS